MRLSHKETFIKNKGRKLVVFTRFPEPGKTKTRLIPSLGAKKAAELQKSMTEHMILTVRELMTQRNLETEVRFDGGNVKNMKKWLGSDIRCRRQGQGDIGVRMAQAFVDSFKEKAEKVIIIGTDCPHITSKIINQAFELLTTHDIVIGPAVDGGYYLIGLKKMVHQLFKDIEWSTDRVLKKTQQVIEQEGLRLALLDELHDIDRPEDLPVWKKLKEKLNNPFISVIIPTLNEEENIISTITSTQTMCCKNVEIIVVDGGSTDNTVKLARSTGVTILMSSKGRARQMNTGAEEAKGEILVFLHADTILPRGCDYTIIQILNKPGVALGAFRLGISASGISLRIIEMIANLRSHFFQMPYGDQAFFIKKSLFKEVGGFNDMPIMEDFVFVRTVQKHGKVVLSPLSVITSARRWIHVGPLRTTLINWAIIISYYLGIHPRHLARWYGRNSS